jgi:hypothetical protein
VLLVRFLPVPGWDPHQRLEGTVSKPKFQTKVHIVIPDTQVSPGVPTMHMGWIGQYIKDEYDGADLTVVHLGDHWTMDSLSTYDRKGGQRMEGRRYLRDVDAGNKAFSDLHLHFKPVKCRRVFLMGNHEYRINRAAESDAQLEGVVDLSHLCVGDWGWEVHNFLEPVKIDGVTYAHYFANPMTGRPYGGASMDTRLKTVGYSFTGGHEQGLKIGIRSLTNGERHRALVAGSCYIHDEQYLGPQGNNCWRGILVCHGVERGNYDLMEVSLDYLARRYEGKRLSAVKWRK